MQAMQAMRRRFHDFLSLQDAFTRTPDAQLKWQLRTLEALLLCRSATSESRKSDWEWTFMRNKTSKSPIINGLIYIAAYGLVLYHRQVIGVECEKAKGNRDQYTIVKAPFRKPMKQSTFREQVVSEQVKELRVLHA